MRPASFSTRSGHAGSSADPPAGALFSLPLEGALALALSRGGGEGKTAGMAKGLQLRHRGKIIGGEAAGFGLPVLLHRSGSVFPSLETVRGTGPREAEMTFLLDRRVRWTLLGLGLPRAAGALGEALCRLYISLPPLQGILLRARGAASCAFRLEPCIVRGSPLGRCRVVCRTDGMTLSVEARGEPSDGSGTYSLLNEGPGRLFTLLRAGGEVREGSRIRGWSSLPPGCRFEAPRRGLFFEHLPGVSSPAELSLEGGREVGRGLDWSGFAVRARGGSLAYCLRFGS